MSYLDVANIKSFIYCLRSLYTAQKIKIKIKVEFMTAIFMNIKINKKKSLASYPTSLRDRDTKFFLWQLLGSAGPSRRLRDSAPPVPAA